MYLIAFDSLRNYDKQMQGETESKKEKPPVRMIPSYRDESAAFMETIYSLTLGTHHSHYLKQVLGNAFNARPSHNGGIVPGFAFPEEAKHSGLGGIALDSVQLFHFALRQE